MSFGTVIPKTAASFSEYVIDAVESDNSADLPSEEKLKEINNNWKNLKLLLQGES